LISLPRLGIDGGPFHSLSGRIAFPLWPSTGQYLPERQREQLSREGRSTGLRNRPYFLLGTVGNT